MSPENLSFVHPSGEKSLSISLSGSPSKSFPFGLVASFKLSSSSLLVFLWLFGISFQRGGPMDSGNSGSFQSSSGDEEFDSRPADSISAIMNNNNKRRAIQGIQANPLSKPSQINTLNFDPLSNYMDVISRPPPPGGVHTPNPLLNFDTSWSKTLRSAPNSTADHHQNPDMISSSSNIPSFFGSFATTTTTSPSPAISINPAVAENNNTSTSASATNTPRPASDQSNPGHVVRNPKKRSRASRRAPTTVLTTDTTNFRAMVQEFTGIPAPPFTSSPFSRAAPRLDLYGTSPSGLRSNPLDSSQPPSYLRRPFPQKVQLPPPAPPPSLSFLACTLSSSTSSPLLNSTSMVDLDHANNITSTSTAAAAALNFQLPTQTSAPNLFTNLPSHLILSSALLQSKFPPANPSPNIGLEIPSKETHLKVGGTILDQFGHVNTSALSGLPGLISSDQTTPRNSDNNPLHWDGNGNLNLSSRMNAATNGKMNFSSSNPSNFHGDKGMDNVTIAASRGEGMMESWICSSD